MMLFIAFFYDGRPEAYAEFVDPEPEQFAREIVPRLVHHDHEHERYEGEENVADVGEDFTRRGRRQRKDHFILLLWNKCICEPLRLFRLYPPVRRHLCVRTFAPPCPARRRCR